CVWSDVHGRGRRACGIRSGRAERGYWALCGGRADGGESLARLAEHGDAERGADLDGLLLLLRRYRRGGATETKQRGPDTHATSGVRDKLCPLRDEMLPLLLEAYQAAVKPPLAG